MAVPGMTHNPQRIIELLRDHLAAHDKRMLFLFGAGTSSGVNVAPSPPKGTKPSHIPLIPAIDEMTAKCKKAVNDLSPLHAAAWTAIEAECQAMHLVPHIESMLGRIRLKVNATGPQEGVLGLSKDELLCFEQAIRETIVGLASPAKDVIPDRIPHDDFALWVRHARRNHPIEIFTTNYDILIERSLDQARVPVFDGFVGSYEPYFSPDAFELDAAMPGADWARLWKMHGSINWENRRSAVIRNSVVGSGEMILPSHRKYDESRKQPYLALMDRLTRSMSQDGTLLVTCGYSWSDQHINDVIRSALDAHPANHAVALMYAALDDVPDPCSLAESRQNLVVIGPREGIVNRVRASWALPHHIDTATASFVDIAFDSDFIPDGAPGSVSGEVRLGDFNKLCTFLARMDALDGDA